ncbi:putative reverse transcriptase, RNA-dependent DNA polymerase, partial [Tanacetum coccineum]
INSNDFAGLEVSIGEGTTGKETDTSQDYIVMPLWKDSSLFDSPSMNVSHDEPEPSCDAEKKDDEGVSKASRVDDQERPESSTPNINTAGPSINTASTNLRTGSLHINTVSPTVLTTRSNRPQSVSDIISMRHNVTPKATNADLFGDETEIDMSNLNASYHVPTTPNTRIHKDHSLDHVIGDIQSGVQTRGMTKTANEQGLLSVAYERKPHEDLNTYLFFCFLSQEEPKRVTKALSDSAWVEAMQEELLQFKLQKVWVLVDLPKGKRAIGTKWIFKNKKDERGIVIKNKARLIEEEVYVCQPPGFDVLDYSDNVYKVVKALYGLHQAPRVWYETLAKYLLDNGFHKGKIDHTLFIKKQKGDILLVQMSSMGELTFFLGLQVKQKEDGIFISQDKYVTDILKKFGFQDCKKQTVVATSSTKAEYVAAASCCRQDKQIEYLMLNASPLKHKRGRDTKIPQSSGPLVKVGDEAVHKELGDRIKWATTTAFSLEAVQDSVKTITEASLRRHLKLEDSDGITSLQNTEIFEQLALMGVFKGYSGVDFHLFPTMITAPESSPSKITSSPSLSPQTHQSHQSLPLRDITRQAAKIPQSQFPTQTQVADEATFTSVDVDAGGAATTDIGLDAGQGSGTIHKTPTRPHDSPLPRVHTLRSDEGSLQQNELMDLLPS